VPISDASGRHTRLAPVERLALPVKLNIHIPVRGPLLEYCVQLNAAISAIASNEISFAPDSFQVPHVTLYMGFAESEAALQGVLREAEQFARSLKTTQFEVSRPYLKDPKRQWVFLDVDSGSAFKGLKVAFKRRVEQFLVPMSWDVVGETPHITLAYLGRETQGVGAVLQSAPTAPPLEASVIEVSFGGARGSCLGSIRSFDFC
jgi:hypothetical protein